MVILSNGLEHNHNELLKNEKKRPVSQDMTGIIFGFFKTGLHGTTAVNAHLNMLRDKFNLFPNEPNPDIRQLEYIRKKFINSFIKPVINDGDMAGFCENNRQFPNDKKKRSFWIMKFVHSRKI